MANPFMHALGDAMRSRQRSAALDRSAADWICENTTSKKGVKFSFTGYPFQREICDDMHPDFTCIKCSQVGISEVQIRKALAFLKRNRSTKAIYTMPNVDMFKRVSKSRIMPLLKEPIFNEDENKSDMRSMDLIQIGGSFLYVTASNEGDATSIDADAVFNDEVDLTDQGMIALFQSRLQNSSFRIRQRFSTPTYVGFGIDASYAISDQHEFFIKCDACNHWQVPVFEPQFIHLPGLAPSMKLSEIDEATYLRLNTNDAYVCCEKCRAPLDLGREDNRRWVAAYPSRTTRGRRVRPFSASRLNIDYILKQLLEYMRLDNIRGWYNTVLGEAYTAGSAQLSDSEINQNFREAGVPSIDSRAQVALGIDMGQTCHLVAGELVNGVPLPFLFEAIPADDLVERVAQICTIYNVVTGACDRHPYTPTANALREATENKVWPVEYRGSHILKPVTKPEDPDSILHWQTDRTSMLDVVANAVRKGMLPMRGYRDHKENIRAHLRDMVREETAETPATWVKLTGNDHYFHALGFLLLSTRIPSFIASRQDVETRFMLELIGASSNHADPNLVNIGNRKRDYLARSSIR